MRSPDGEPLLTLQPRQPASQFGHGGQRAYAWTGNVNGTKAYTPNGLNQYANVAGAGFTYDPNGNLTSDGSTTYGYDVENRLVSASGAHSSNLTYDPNGRLFQTTVGNTVMGWTAPATASMCQDGVVRQPSKGAVHGQD